MSIKMDDILKIFIENPEKEFYVRELARKLNLSPTTVSKELKELEKKGLLVSKMQFNHLLFSAKTENLIFKQHKLNYNMMKVSNSGLVDYLEEILNPKAIGIFGSFAKAENIKKSDIDVYVISSRKKELDLARFEKRLGHLIQLFVFSKDELNEMKKKNKELLNSMINGIVLSGYLEVF